MSIFTLVSEQRDFSLPTFGPGYHTNRLIDHIKSELEEVAERPLDLEEWVDVVLLALDGAWRTGATAFEIEDALFAKLHKNQYEREWPDIEDTDPDRAVEHIAEPQADGHPYAEEGDDQAVAYLDGSNVEEIVDLIRVVESDLLVDPKVSEYLTAAASYTEVVEVYTHLALFRLFTGDTNDDSIAAKAQAGLSDLIDGWPEDDADGGVEFGVLNLSFA